MFCKKCGQRLPENFVFCNNCGTKVNNSTKDNSPLPISIDTSIVEKSKNNKIIPVIVIVIIVLFAVIMLAVFNGGGKSSGKKSAETYLKACYKEDVNEMISLVPDSVINKITKEYRCSKKEMKEAVSEEISYLSDDYSHFDDKIVKSYKVDSVNQRDYEDYFDRRVEMCIDFDKMSSIEIYRVELKNNYYFDIPVYKYNGKWYTVDAATFVAYAVWERH